MATPSFGAWVLGWVGEQWGTVPSVAHTHMLLVTFVPPAPVPAAAAAYSGGKGGRVHGTRPQHGLLFSHHAFRRQTCDKGGEGAKGEVYHWWQPSPLMSIWYQVFRLLLCNKTAVLEC